MIASLLTILFLIRMYPSIWFHPFKNHNFESNETLWITNELYWDNIVKHGNDDITAINRSSKLAPNGLNRYNEDRMDFLISHHIRKNEAVNLQIPIFYYYGTNWKACSDLIIEWQQPNVFYKNEMEYYFVSWKKWNKWHQQGFVLPFPET